MVLTPSRQGRIATAKKASATSIQAVYVPADDSMALAPATNFATWVLPVSTRPIAELGIHPAIDPLDSKSRMSDLRIVRVSLSRDAKQAGHGTLQGCDCYTKDSPGLWRCFAAGKGTVLPHNQSHMDPLPEFPWPLAPRPARASTILRSWLCSRRNIMLAIVSVASTRCTSQRCLVPGLFSTIQGITDVAREGGQEMIASGTRGWLDPPHV